MDDESAEREARFGGRYLLAWVSVVALLAVGLVLQGAGVWGGGWVAAAAVVGMLLLFYVVPWLGLWRSGRSRERPEVADEQRSGFP